MRTFCTCLFSLPSIVADTGYKFIVAVLLGILEQRTRYNRCCATFSDSLLLCFIFRLCSSISYLFDCVVSSSALHVSRFILYFPFFHSCHFAAYFLPSFLNFALPIFYLERLEYS